MNNSKNKMRRASNLLSQSSRGRKPNRTATRKAVVTENRGAGQRRAGMTLLEIMVVVLIVGMLATAVGTAVLPQLKKARIRTTRADAEKVRSAVSMFVAENSDKDCPNTEDLVKEGFLDKGKRINDAWDTAFEIKCEGDNIQVSSAGPDKQFGTPDDIVPGE